MSTGGTGKTPFVLFLLANFSYSKNVSVLSRGYGRLSKELLEVKKDGNVHEYGDEASLIKNSFPNCNVIVSNSRKDGLKFIEKNYPSTNLIIMDDGFQHRWVKPSLSIILTPFSKPFFKDYLLPYGRLRESRKNISRAEILIVTKSPQSDFSKLEPVWRMKSKLNINQSLFFTGIAYNPILYSLNKKEQISLDNLKDCSVMIVTAIANNDHLFNFIESKARILYTFNFPDHHYFNDSDLKSISLKYNSLNQSNLVIISTSKDAVKLRNLENFTSFDLPFYILEIQPDFFHEGKKKEFINYIEKIC